MDIIQATAAHVRKELEAEFSGHDWWHVYRVWRLSKLIGKAEGAHMPTVELAALLHDIADWKFHGEGAGVKRAREWLEHLNVSPALIQHVCDIIEKISFKGANVAQPELSLEGKVVQDADRLDAIGAIGIARCFAYGGFKRRPIHTPEISPQLHASPEAYMGNNSSSINHFHEKLLLLKDRMNTATARKLAEGRHRFMLAFLKQFQREWELK